MSYSKLSKLLHRLALNSDLRCEVMFDFERSLYSKNIEQADHHIFVHGLARAGTTIFMRSVYDTGEFASLTYRDMPFLMMPNFWKKISTHNSMSIKESERAHGDGIKVNFDSPEALEEVFWRVFTGRSYIYSDRLSQYDASAEVIDLFKEYVALITVRYGKKRYLSKNNNNILRCNTISKAFPDSYIVIPFRDPLVQSASLLNQHKHFVERHSVDEFSKKYMRWLVHHEFGADHRRFEFNRGQSDFAHKDPYSLGYWLEQWLNTYIALFYNHSHHSKIYFVCYEDLYSGPRN